MPPVVVQGHRVVEPHHLEVSVIKPFSLSDREPEHLTACFVPIPVRKAAYIESEAGTSMERDQETRSDSSKPLSRTEYTGTLCLLSKTV